MFCFFIYFFGYADNFMPFIIWTKCRLNGHHGYVSISPPIYGTRIFDDPVAFRKSDLSSSSVVGWLAKTFDRTYPQRKKYGGVKSHDIGGHLTGPFRQTLYAMCPCLDEKHEATHRLVGNRYRSFHQIPGRVGQHHVVMFAINGTFFVDFLNHTGISLTLIASV